jgi:hypothetical protein
MNGKLPTPKRGAFPTPKEGIDKAPRYVPEPSNSTEDERRDQTGSSPDRRQGDETTDEPKESKPK